MQRLIQRRLFTRSFKFTLPTCLTLLILLLSFNYQADSTQPPPSQLKSELITQFVQNLLAQSNLHSQPKSLEKLKLELGDLQSRLVHRRNDKCLYELNGGEFGYSAVHYVPFVNKYKFDAAAEETRNFTAFVNSTVDDFNKNCINSSDLIELVLSFNENNGQYTDEDVEKLQQILLTQLSNPGCDFCVSSGPPKHPISRLETWGYGILFVAVISLSSLCGAFVIPFSKRKIYKKILMFLIAIAVGSLAGSGFLHLIPQAYGITDDPKYSRDHVYAWKSVVMMAGVYLFFLVEIILKLMILRRKMSKKNTSSKSSKSIKTENPLVFESIGYVKPHEAAVEPNVEMRMHLSENVLVEMQNMENDKKHGHSHGIEKGGGGGGIAPVAWMIIFGDGLHNFIDGLSIGAAFTESIAKGVSICLAVICEEFPHELGDFAILINAGMSYPVALLFNFLSACACFVGLAVGITLGENLKANEWIYAVAGGMFLYIALCDMIPELNEMGDEIERDYIAADVARRHKNQSESSPNGGHNHVAGSGDGAKKKKGCEGGEDEESRSLTTNVDHSRSLTAAMDAAHNDVSFIMKIKIKIIIIQNIGILTGFSFMLLMALYAEKIQFS